MATDACPTLDGDRPAVIDDRGSSLRRFAGRCEHQQVVVCGCGPSLRGLASPQRLATIGVNDVGRLFDPTYLVVVNPRQQFKGDRFRYVERSRAQALFTQLDLGSVQPPAVRFRLGRYGGTDVDVDDELPYTQNSPYVAVCLAAYMGATRIGLIGVDFTDDHFFGRTGRHPLAARLPQIDREYGALADALRRRGVELVNLSAASRLTSLAKVGLGWLDETRARAAPAVAQQPKALRIVSYATTPVAGVPAVLARCVAAATDDTARCVWAADGYTNGVRFAGDVEWNRQPREALALLDAADAVIVHNGKVDPAHRALLEGKPVVTMAHNYGWNVDLRFVQRGQPGVVVGQYQATLLEFAEWAIVPNPIPLWESEHRPGPRGEGIVIAYTPSGRHERYPLGHRLYWHGKGFDTTLRVLRALEQRHGVHIETTAQGQVSHACSLAMKRRAHIVIDECVTGSYHRNSLEGLAVGTVVVNGVGLIPGVREALARCAGECPDGVFVASSLDGLEATLERLIALGADELVARGLRGRAWMDAHWDFAAQWQTHWRPVIERAIDARPRLPRARAVPAPGAAAPAASVTTPAPAGGDGLSVVIPFGGRQRLGLLAATLAGMRRSAVVDQIVVVELGEEPLALDLARGADAEHVFVRHAGAFDKARALNTGSLLARHPELLWCDADLLFGDDFLASAQQEFRARGLDFLFPFSRIEYLGEADSEAVCAGTRRPQDCRSTHVLQPIGGGAIGGMGLVRAGFLRRCGGMIEGFLGWGGEDNAWIHKARLLGRVGSSDRVDQVAWHLYHPDSGGIGAQPWRSNPHYGRNVGLLGRIQCIRTGAELLRQFPPPAGAMPPWPPHARLCFAVMGDGGDASIAADDWAQRLQRDYGVAVPVMHCSGAGLAAVSEAQRADVLVGFADDAASCQAFVAAARGRAAILVPGAQAIDDLAAAALAGPAWLLARTPAQALRWRNRGLPAWHVAWQPEAPDRPPVLVQPLSHLLATRAAPAASEVPVWSYWEGPMPDWIAACLETVRCHAPTLRLLGPAEFDALRDRDRDVDLSRLHVAQRADFVRTFLLMRFGGLWIDADCLVMRDLGELLSQLGGVDCIVHRERQGLYSNAFLAAAPGSVVAARLYDAVCARLRSGQPLGWIALGNEPLTQVLDEVAAPRLELPTERIQPVCWSRPQEFFRQGDDAQHARAVDPDALCYMLSQQNVNRFLKATPGASLTAPRSFFSFLLRRALGQTRAAAPAAPAGAAREPALVEAFARMCREHAAQGHESLSGPGSSLRQTAQLRRELPLLLRRLGARVLLDVPCGDFHWMKAVDLGGCAYIGIDLLEDLIRRNLQRYANPHRHFETGNLLEGPLPPADVVLCRDCLVHLPDADVVRALRQIVASGAGYLLATTFPGRPQRPDVHVGGWRPVNLQAPPFSLPPPLQFIDEHCTEGGGAFRDKSLGLWRVAELRSWCAA